MAEHYRRGVIPSSIISAGQYESYLDYPLSVIVLPFTGVSRWSYLVSLPHDNAPYINLPFHLVLPPLIEAWKELISQLQLLPALVACLSKTCRTRTRSPSPRYLEVVHRDQKLLMNTVESNDHQFSFR